MTTAATLASVINSVTGKLNTALINAGGVLQVLNMSYNTSVSIGTGAAVDTGLMLSITPSSTSSKILIIANVSGLEVYSANTGVSFDLLRNGSGLVGFGTFYGYPVSVYMPGGQLTYLDSPATTSSVTYKVQHQRTIGSGTGVVNGDGSRSFFTLMEIAG